MYYNAQKLKAVYDELTIIIAAQTENYTSLINSDIEKLFETQNIDIIKTDELKKYSWSSWYKDDLISLQKELMTMLTENVNIEDRQTISNSIIDQAYEESYNDVLGSFRSFYGNIQHKDQDIIRMTVRKVLEFQKSKS